MPSLLIRGHHGLGDNLHQRAIVRQLLAAGNDVWIETPWPSVYHDLPVHTVAKPSALRTQAKNLTREADRFSKEPVPSDAKVIQLRYSGDGVRRTGSVLAAMSCPGFDPAVADFRLPVPRAWKWAASMALCGWDGRKPIMLYRPLVERAEFTSGSLRNPDHVSYATLFKSVRSKYFVVSVADLEPNKEWIVGERMVVDARFHRGELSFEALAGLAFLSDLVFCAPGFATVLAQAVETPCVTVFGGYERGDSFSAGARHSRYLAIEPKEACACFNGACPKRCEKIIDMPAALAALERFTC